MCGGGGTKYFSFLSFVFPVNQKQSREIPVGSYLLKNLIYDVTDTLEKMIDGLTCSELVLESRAVVPNLILFAEPLISIGDFRWHPKLVY